MNKKGLVIMMIGILSTSLVFGMGKVDAVDEGTNEVKATPTVGHRYSFNDSDRAKTADEKRRILLEIIKYEPETNEDWAISENAQTQYNALNEFMGLDPTKAEIETVIDKLYSAKSSQAKRNIMEFLSYSQYKDIVAVAFKKVAETDEDLSVRGYAMGRLISMGDEEKGFEYMKKLIDVMDIKKEIISNFIIFLNFENEEIKEKMKSYLLALRDNQTKGEMIRCYAALICNKKYKVLLSPYYPIIEKFILNSNVEENEVKIILGKIEYLSRKNDPNAKKIMAKAKKSGGTAVKELLKKWNK